MSEPEQPQQLAKPTLQKHMVRVLSSADAAYGTDYTAKPALKPYHFGIYAPADLINVFGL